jgi:hypothetical protein
MFDHRQEPYWIYLNAKFADLFYKLLHGDQCDKEKRTKVWNMNTLGLINSDRKLKP